MTVEAEAKKALLTLFHCFPQSGESTERAAKFDAYWAALSDLPLELIVRVCAKASRGNVGKSGYLPTAGELHTAAVKMLPPAVDYFRSDVRMLEAHIPLNEREIVKQGLSDLVRELASNARKDGVSKA